MNGFACSDDHILLHTQLRTDHEYSGDSHPAVALRSTGALQMRPQETILVASLSKHSSSGRRTMGIDIAAAIRILLLYRTVSF